MTLLELFTLLRNRLTLVIVLPVVLALVAACVSWGFLPNEYTATVSVYVLTANENKGSNSTTYNDLTASQLMANDIATLAKSETVRSKAAQNLSMTSLSGYDISVQSSTTTRVVDISVSTEDGEAAATVANELSKVLSDTAKEIMGVESVKVIDKAKVPSSPSGPQRIMYTAVAFFAGIFLAVAIVVLEDMLDMRVRTSEEVEKLLGLPIIGHIPTMKM